MLSDHFIDALTRIVDSPPVCRYCKRPLVGAEVGACDPCTDELCAACGEDSVEFYVPGLPCQLCQGCYNQWMNWDDPALDAIAVPLETDLQESRERFVEAKEKTNAE